jgi:hypothetical protein
LEEGRSFYVAGGLSHDLKNKPEQKTGHRGTDTKWSGLITRRDQWVRPAQKTDLSPIAKSARWRLDTPFF